MTDENNSNNNGVSPQSGTQSQKFFLSLSENATKIQTDMSIINYTLKPIISAFPRLANAAWVAENRYLPIVSIVSSTGANIIKYGELYRPYGVPAEIAGTLYGIGKGIFGGMASTITGGVGLGYGFGTGAYKYAFDHPPSTILDIGATLWGSFDSGLAGAWNTSINWSKNADDWAQNLYEQNLSTASGLGKALGLNNAPAVNLGNPRGVGGQGGGGGLPHEVHPNSETPSMAEDRLKHNPPQTHDNPSNESQHEAYLKEHFKNSSMTEDQYFETLRTIYENRGTLESLGKGALTTAKGAWDSMFYKPSGTILQGKVEEFYDPIVKDFQENWPNNVKGTVASYEQAIWGKKGDELMPVQPGITGIASQPFGRTKPFSTPNAEAIKNTLYSGIKLGTQYMTGYLVDRYKDKILGKKLSKAVDKFNQYAGYVKTFAPNVWEAASGAVKAFASAAWQPIAQTAFGQAIAGAATAMWGAITAIGSAIATAVTTVAASVIGWAISALAFLPW
ncbi:MAG: hypothetical protein WC220_13235 [Pedobacter sp.]|jgi:hypothetical protein